MVAFPRNKDNLLSMRGLSSERGRMKTTVDAKCRHNSKNAESNWLVVTSAVMSVRSGP